MNTLLTYLFQWMLGQQDAPEWFHNPYLITGVLFLILIGALVFVTCWYNRRRMRFGPPRVKGWKNYGKYDEGSEEWG